MKRLKIQNLNVLAERGVRQMNTKYRDNTPELGVIESQILDVSDFTDVAANGTIEFNKSLPAGAIPLAWEATVLTPFARKVVFTGDPTTLSFGDGDGGSSQDTIADSASGFVTDGFQVGDEITITGATTAGNDITATLTAVAAGLLTFAAGNVAAEEAGAVGMTLTAEKTVTATLQLGVAGDVDRFTADTAKSLTTAGIVGSACIAADACDGIGSSQTILATVTETSDFSDYTEGAFKASVFYVKTRI
jgi:hypothetical protein